MKTMKTVIQGSRSNPTRQRGQGMTEYIIITALIAIAAIGAVTYFGSTARSQVAAMSRELSGQTGTEMTNRAVKQANLALEEGKDDKSLKQYTNTAAK
ncbi:MAG: pilus assembly protein [Gammaproteobacteria bacterium HGW-Gammaproteobacteria-6]|jgi:Flp pilus assembly pilin Flp|nr:MAG: pilus assembly protein [Gammaproteobacteria bacterium HGW-Gammaproteobacteria-6]PKM16675.1 MAG: pilus assembly protein [Gammaproteobacteria bacterium HGW-Gammaproteobacteria-2]